MSVQVNPNATFSGALCELRRNFLEELAARGESERNVAAHGLGIDRFAEFLAPRPAEDARPKDLEAFLSYLSELGVTSSSLKTYRTVVQRWVEFLGERREPEPETSPAMEDVATPDSADEAMDAPAPPAPPTASQEVRADKDGNFSTLLLSGFSAAVTPESAAKLGVEASVPVCEPEPTTPMLPAVAPPIVDVDESAAPQVRIRDMPTEASTPAFEPLDPDVPPPSAEATFEPLDPDVPAPSEAAAFEPLDPDVPAGTQAATFEPLDPDVPASTDAATFEPLDPDVPAASEEASFEPLDPDVPPSTDAASFEPLDPDVPAASEEASFEPLDPDVPAATGDAAFEALEDDSPGPGDAGFESVASVAPSFESGELETNEPAAFVAPDEPEADAFAAPDSADAAEDLPSFDLPPADASAAEDSAPPASDAAFAPMQDDEEAVDVPAFGAMEDAADVEMPVLEDETLAAARERDKAKLAAPPLPSLEQAPAPSVPGESEFEGDAASIPLAASDPSSAGEATLSVGESTHGGAGRPGLADMVEPGSSTQPGTGKWGLRRPTGERNELSLETLISMAASGELAPEDMVRKPNGEWAAASELRPLRRALGLEQTGIHASPIRQMRHEVAVGRAAAGMVVAGLGSGLVWWFTTLAVGMELVPLAILGGLLGGVGARLAARQAGFKVGAIGAAAAPMSVLVGRYLVYETISSGVALEGIQEVGGFGSFLGSGLGTTQLVCLALGVLAGLVMGSIGSR